MNNSKIFYGIYYHLKPLIPRRVQIWLRRKLILRKRLSCQNIWPIDERAGKPPVGWKGWPEKKQFALVLMHDVDTGKGQDNCLELIKIDKELGFRSSFNLVPERYSVSPDLRNYLLKEGFEVGVHGLKHDGKLFLSRKAFQKQAILINNYLKEWKSVGFVSPSMHRNLEWIHDLNIEYDASTFDTDPFEPQPEGVGTIFPFWVSATRNVQLETRNPSNPSNSNNSTNPINSGGFVELPYTLPQDFTLFILMKEKNIGIWKEKIDWIAKHGGMAFFITHPDYMNFDGRNFAIDEYPAKYYEEFLQHIKRQYEGEYWHVLPKDMAKFWRGLGQET